MAELQSLPQTSNANAIPPNANDAPTSGNPTTPSLARGQVANTSISVSNSNLTHVCDISGTMKYNIAVVSLEVKQLIESIRQTIQELWQGTSSSPFGQGVSAAITAIKNMVNQIQNLIQKAQEAQAEIQGYIAQLQQLLIYIATIPARIAAQLKECLSEATASIKDAINNAKSIVTSQNNGDLSTANTNSDTASSNLNTTENTTIGSSEPVPVQKP